MYRLSRQSHTEDQNLSFVPETEIDQSQDPMRSVASALAENRLTVAFQSVVSARNPKIPAFHECLARIQKRNGETTPAARFMPQIEHSDIGRLVDRAILRKAVNILKDTQRVRLSVNLSAHGIGDMAWLEILETACADAPQCGEFLIIEITESAILNLTHEKFAFLNKVRDLGCSIALDDFGAGHTSIGQLGKFRFDFLKIDGSYIEDILENEDHQFLLKSMVSIARHFEMVSVAEKVENLDVSKVLTDMGVDCLQGYAFGKPSLNPDFLNRPDREIAWSI